MLRPRNFVFCSPEGGGIIDLKWCLLSGQLESQQVGGTGIPQGSSPLQGKQLLPLRDAGQGGSGGRKEVSAQEADLGSYYAAT